LAAEELVTVHLNSETFVRNGVRVIEIGKGLTDIRHDRWRPVYRAHWPEKLTRACHWTKVGVTRVSKVRQVTITR
jgi:hypothetical protein